MEQETSDFVLFLGRFHPLILHLPIGFLTLAFTLEVLSRFKRFSHFKPSVEFVLLVGAVSAALAALLGYFLAQSGGYHEGILSVHQWTGIGVAVVSGIAILLKRLYGRKPTPSMDKAYLGSLGAMMLLMTIAGHFGGSLTHGSDYLSQYMPDGLRRLAGMPPKEKKEIRKIANLNEAVVYTDIIAPILDARCNSCHNEGKRKGDLMMHTPEHLMKGGENGAILRPGDAANSSMIQRILLPEDHEDHMPPEGKSQLTAEQVRLLMWWVNEGAPFDKKVAELHVADSMQSILNALADPNYNKSEAEILLASRVEPADQQALLQFRARGIMVAPLSDSINWLQANIAPKLPADSVLKALTTFSNQLTWLNLSGTSTTDEGMAAVGAMKNLTKLHLGNTDITDEGLKHLQDLTYLETLNLYGTTVTDKGLQTLSKLKNLKTLYLWQTKATQEGAEALKEAIPSLQVNLGMQVSSK